MKIIYILLPILVVFTFYGHSTRQTLNYFIFYMPIVIVFSAIIFRLITGSWDLPKKEIKISEEVLKKDRISFYKFVLKIVVVAILAVVVVLISFVFIMKKFYL